MSCCEWILGDQERSDTKLCELYEQRQQRIPNLDASAVQNASSTMILRGYLLLDLLAGSIIRTPQ